LLLMIWNSSFYLCLLSSIIQTEKLSILQWLKTLKSFG
jgi:hypothetical protein